MLDVRRAIFDGYAKAASGASAGGSARSDLPALDDRARRRRDNFIMLTISRVRRLSVTVFIPVTGKRSL
jgi:hypothetical protein